MRKNVVASVIAALVLASCVSTPAGPGKDTTIPAGSAQAGSAQAGSAQAGSAQAASAQTGTDKTVSVASTATASASAGQDVSIDALIAKARSSIDANHLAEGIKFYISALARATKTGQRARADEISGTLNAIGARLTLEPHESWLAPDGSQKTASTRSAARGEGLMPAVYLYESYGYAKSAVPDAFIRFEFVSNAGSLTESVTTDSRGLANTGITSISAPGKDAQVRAYPIFTSEGFSYAFKATFRDFAFVAPPNLAIVAVMEKTPAGESANPRVLDTVASSLKPLGVEVVPFNGVLASARFNAAFGGDSSALAALAGSVKAGYFALVHVEVATPTRMEYGGKVYNIYTANAKATLRIVRLDGTVVFARPVDGIKGQGGTDQAAIEDSLVKVRDQLAQVLGAESATIRKAFSE